MYQSVLINRVLIIRWGNPEVRDADALLRESLRASEKAGRSIINIMIMPSDIPAPEGEARKAMGQRAKELLQCTETVHCVIEGSGFKTSIKRSVTTSVILLSGQRGRVFVHKDLNEALAFLDPQLQEAGILPSKILQAAHAKGLLTAPSLGGVAASP
jgi:hypothetical protein